MNTLGIHLTRRRARAVIADANGDVLESAALEEADPLAAMAVALPQLRAGRTLMAAVAVDSSDGPDAKAIARALEGAGCTRGVQVVSAGAAAVTVEAWKGAAQGAQHAICLWIGDTVLAGILLNGSPWTGAHGFAGSAAWLALNPVERQDYRKFGSLAAEVSD
jgi:predicted NBD/HSP70 family sugar kinase